MTTASGLSLSHSAVQQYLSPPLMCHHCFVSHLKVYYLFTFFLPHLKHPQTSSPGECCQDDRFMSEEQNHPSGALSHRGLPDSLMKVGAHARETSLLCFALLGCKISCASTKNIL
jgi:hypothetical protein